MKFFSTLLFALLSIYGFAQKGTSVPEKYPKSPALVELRFTAENIDPLVEAQKLVPNWDLKLLKQKASPGGEHFHYELKKGDLVLANQGLSVHRYADKSVLIQYPSLQKTQKSLSPFSLDTLKLKQEIGAQYCYAERALFNAKETLIDGYFIELFGAEGLHVQAFADGNELLFLEDQRRHLQASDSTCYTFIFLPDPLSTANVNYGGSYVDNNDGDNAALNNERKLMSFKALYDAGTFRLEDQNIKIEDFSAPTVAPATSNNTTFNFTRSQDGFEDVNAFFHLTNFKDYIDSLGYTSIPGNQIEIDVHALNNSDQSYYSPSELRVYMGEGGVDDAEDADVVIHEYVHSVVYGASANQNRISERSGMEEAICDYFAVSYSLKYSPNQRDRVFNWDGHNAFWPGRMASSTKDYQTLTFNSNIYAHTDLMASCLLEIHDNTSRAIGDALVLEALFSLQNTTTYAQFAAMILQADQNLFSGQYRQIIKDAFVRRNVIPADFSLDEFKLQQPIKLYNTYAFSRNEGSLWIDSVELLKGFELIDLSGNLIQSADLEQYEQELTLPGLKAGLYLLKIKDQAGSNATFKIQVLD